MAASYPEHDVPRVDAGRLWAAGIATALVAGLVTEVGILIARGLMHLAIFAPEGDGLWGNANTTGYAVGAAVVALAATGVLHFLLLTTPRGTMFFGWIMSLLTVVAVVIPLNVIGARPEMIATTVLNVLIGLVVTTLLIGSAGGAQVRRRQQYAEPGYQTREW